MSRKRSRNCDNDGSSDENRIIEPRKDIKKYESIDHSRVFSVSSLLGRGASISMDMDMDMDMSSLLLRLDLCL
jgi:hypothetical protein